MSPTSEPAKDKLDVKEFQITPHNPPVNGGRQGGQIQVEAGLIYGKQCSRWRLPETTKTRRLLLKTMFAENIKKT
jgi:hypothetical protein